MHKKLTFKKIVFYIGFIASIITIISFFIYNGYTTQNSSGNYSPNIVINNN